MPKPSKRWKGVETEVAKIFGTRRTPLSGGSSAHTRSDTLHKKIYIEVKTRKHFSVKTLYDDTSIRAAREGKTPLVVLKEKNQRSYLVVCDLWDIPKIAKEISNA